MLNHILWLEGYLLDLLKKEFKDIIFILIPDDVLFTNCHPTILLFIFIQIILFTLMLKTRIQKGLIYVLGFEKYLSLVSDIRIKTFSKNNKQDDFRTFVNMLPMDAQILDIGANIGVTSCYLSQNTKRCVIHSFEPMPFNYNVLAKIIKARNLKNVNTYNFGLGSKASKLQMILPIIQGVKRHALCQVYDRNSIYSEGEKFTIKIEKLDELTFLSPLS